MARFFLILILVLPILGCGDGGRGKHSTHFQDIPKPADEKKVNDE